MVEAGMSVWSQLGGRMSVRGACAENKVGEGCVGGGGGRRAGGRGGQC